MLLALAVLAAGCSSSHGSPSPSTVALPTTSVSSTSLPLTTVSSTAPGTSTTATLSPTTTSTTAIVPHQSLIRRTGLDAGGWAALIPPTWRLRNCDGLTSIRQNVDLCSFAAGGDTATDVWYNPTHPGDRLEVITCQGGGCFSLGEGGPDIAADLYGISPTTQISPWEMSFRLPAGPSHIGLNGPYPINGIVVASHSGTVATFPVYTVGISLPAANHALATVILDSFTVPPTPTPGG